MINGRVLALDIGTVRIGAAISDPLGITAQGLGVWNAENDEWRKDFDEAIRKYDPKIIVAGLPLRTDGKPSEAAIRISGIIDGLRAEYPGREFVFQDERFTTVIAQRAMIEADISRRKRKKNVDKVAAVIILEDWLESHRQ
ncbi:MAG: Holliday junction resolvase RuvX [Synergistaceae bacterium]|nr:Holliday junction resolvase RuvX [Synergistaceae bacterium]